MATHACRIAWAIRTHQGDAVVYVWTTNSCPASRTGKTYGGSRFRQCSTRGCDLHHITKVRLPDRMKEQAAILNDFPGKMSGEFSELSVALDRVAFPVSRPAGAILFHCGDPVSGVYLIRKGAVSMSLDAHTSIYPPKTLGPGEIAGLPATLTGTYSLSAEVAEDAELGFIPSGRVAELLEASPRLCLLAMRIISGEIARIRSALKDAPAIEHEN